MYNHSSKLWVYSNEQRKGINEVAGDWDWFLHKAELVGKVREHQASRITPSLILQIASQASLPPGPSPRERFLQLLHRTCQGGIFLLVC